MFHGRKRFSSFAVRVTILLWLWSLAARADWLEFRGPWGDGRVSAPGDNKVVGLPLHWSETNNVRWKTAIPYKGWSTPVVLGGQVWITTATEDGHDFFAIGFDADTGKIRFNEKVFHTDNPEPLGNGASMSVRCTGSSDGRMMLIQLVSFDRRAGRVPVSLWVKEQFRTARLWRVGSNEAASLSSKPEQGGREFSLPPFTTYAAVELES